MTKSEAKRYIRSRAEDEGPATYAKAAEIFRAIFGRDPDDDDGCAADLWSHVCAAVGS